MSAHGSSYYLDVASLLLDGIKTQLHSNGTNLILPERQPDTFSASVGTPLDLDLMLRIAEANMRMAALVDESGGMR